MQQRMDIKPDTMSKLVPNLYSKYNSQVDYRYLKYCIEKGLKVTKVHKVISYLQSPWMKPYIDFNMSQRAVAKSKFQKDFFKLMNNAAYGKTMENLPNRIQFELINTEKK